MRASSLFLLLAACATPPRADLEPLFVTLETGGPLEAMEAGEKLARDYDDSLQPRLERALEAKPARAVDLLGRLETPGSARLLLERLPSFLDGPPDLARTAVTACGLRRLRESTMPILERFEKVDARTIYRALGRIWNRSLSEPVLARADEILRLSALAVIHRVALGAESSADTCEALLRIVTRDELADLLGKHAAAKFFARRYFDEAVRRKGFDPQKGARIHEALLTNPDEKLVVSILESSPFALRQEIVKSFLDDKRPGVKDAAAARLAR